MLRQLGICAFTAVCAFAIGTVFVADAQSSGDLEVTVSVEALGISIDLTDLDFGGPHPPNKQLTAHPTGNQFVEAVATPPTITNSGNLPIGRIDVGYAGPLGAEATCDNGEGSWPARFANDNPNGFLMRALASHTTTWATFENSDWNIHPEDGTGNILANGTLNPTDEIPLFLYLRLPQVPIGGGNGCSIALIVTASAS